MLNISWDPVLIAISYLVAFIASFVALDSAGKIPFPAERLPCSGALPGGDAGDWHLVDALYRHAVDANADDDEL
jgi:hypothetical protein